MSKSGIKPKLAESVRKLKEQFKSQTKGAMNSGDEIYVDYFALSDLIHYFDESKEAAVRVVKARDALHNVFFSSGTSIHERD